GSLSRAAPPRRPALRQSVRARSMRRNEVMESVAAAPMDSHSPLEDFLRDYVDVTGGMWEEVEPQVYDLLLPSPVTTGDLAGREVLRIAFDPEAIPEHPGAQLASFGTPLVTSLLADAVARG